jgi:hypothetical protein
MLLTVTQRTYNFLLAHGIELDLTVGPTGTAPDIIVMDDLPNIPVVPETDNPIIQKPLPKHWEKQSKRGKFKKFNRK